MIKTNAQMMTPPGIRILVAESYDLIRMGLRSLFEKDSSIRLVAETDCIEDLLILALQHEPDVILIDLQLNNGNCSKHIAKLLMSCPESKVLAFSQHNNESDYQQIYRLGVGGVISKQHPCKLLLKAIHAVYAGQIWHDQSVASSAPLAPRYSNFPITMHTDFILVHQAKLSDSERRIAFLACKGLSAKEISRQVFVTQKTVRNQLSIIYKKIGVKKQIELCLQASHYNHFQ